MGFYDYIRIIRPMNAFMVTMMALSGIWFSAEFNVNWWSYVLTLVVAVSYIGIAMIHNDIIDLEIDKINAPLRPLPSNKISIASAWIYASLLFLIGTIAGIFLTYQAIIIMISTLLLSLLYNAKLKKTGFLGNVTVGITATSAFLYGDAVGSGFYNFWPINHWNASVYLFLISALLNTAREVSKGIMDVSGDKKYGVNTIAVRFGKRVAAIIVTILIALALLFAIIPIFNHTFGVIYSIAVFIFLLLILRVMIPLIKTPNFETANNFKKQIILIMLLALIIILVDVQSRK